MTGFAKNGNAGFLRVILLVLLVQGCSHNDLSTSTCQLGSYQIGIKGTPSYSYNNYYYNNGRLAGGQDGNGIYTLSYDKQNRISQIDYNEGQFCDIQYDGNGRVIYEIWTFRPLQGTNIVWDVSPTAPLIYKFTYNSSGQLTMQKTISLNAPGDSSIMQAVTFQYPNSKTRNFSSSSLLIADTLTINSTYEYDTRVNPFLVTGYNLTSSFNSTDNNITQVAVTELSKQKLIYSDTYTYTYTYTNTGYPLTQAYSSQIWGSSMTTFSYTNCH